ncbi:MAG: dTMP kinase, partial [Candidatus Thermoplasmatota archaeon]
MKKFITFEGIDGSGKSTIAEKTYEKLKNKGYNVILTYEPTDSPIGRYVQKCIKNKNDPYLTSFAFIADRIQHCMEIEKWLKEDKIILCDRYADSTYAYQSAQLESEIKKPIKWLQELSEPHIIKPDRTFILIIEPEKALKRIKKRKELIPFETVSFL